MYFYRYFERNGVDLLLPTGGKMHAIEIKAGATVNPDYFKGLKTFAGEGLGYAAEVRPELPLHQYRQN